MNKWKIVAVVLMALAMKTKAAPGLTNSVYSKTNIDYMMLTNRTYTSNLVYSAVSSNSVVNYSNLWSYITNVPQASLWQITQKTVTMSASAYVQVTGLEYGYTNQFIMNLTDGVLTNQVAGYYNVHLDCSYTGGNTIAYEGEIFTNMVACDAIAFERTMGSTATIGVASAHNIIYLPANSRIDFRIKNDGGTANVIIEKFQLSLTKIR